MAKADWSIPEQPGDRAAFDEQADTVWTLNRQSDLTIDLKQERPITNIIYTPPTSPAMGKVYNYEIYISNQTNSWGKPVSKGEFSNIENSPTFRIVEFPGHQGTVCALCESCLVQFTSGGHCRNRHFRLG